MPNLTKNTRKLIIDLFKEGYAVVDLSHIYGKSVSVIEEVIRKELISAQYGWQLSEKELREGLRGSGLGELKQAVKGA